MNKYFLYNIIEKGFSINSVQNLLRKFKSDDVNIDILFSFVRYMSGTSTLNYENFIMLMNNSYSIYLLAELDIYQSIIEDIKKQYEYFTDFINDLFSEKLKVRLDSYTTDKLKYSYNEIKTHLSFKTEEIKKNIQNDDVSSFSELNFSIQKALSENIPLQINEISIWLFKKGFFFQPSDLRDELKKLIETNKILYMNNRYWSQTPDIKQYASYSDYQPLKLLSQYANHNLIHSGVSETVFKESILVLSPKLPVFLNELELYDILNKYSVPFYLLDHGVYSIELYTYVQIKYDTTPPGNEVDYIVDNSLFENEKAKSVLARKSQFAFNRKIFGMNFHDFTRAYMDEYKKSDYISLEDFSDIHKFKRICIPFTYHSPKLFPVDSDSFKKMLESEVDYYRDGNKYYNIGQYIQDSDFRLELISILNQIGDIFSINRLFHSFPIFKQYSMSSAHKLYLIMKNMRLDLDGYFITNYIIYKSDIDKALWIDDFIIENDIKNEVDFYDQLKNSKGIGKSEFNSIFDKQISKLNWNDINISQLPEDVLYQFSNFLKLGFASVEGISEFVRSNRFNYRIRDFINISLLHSMKFILDKGMIFSSKFDTPEQAIDNYINLFATKVIKKSCLLSVLGESYFNYYYKKLRGYLKCISVSEEYLYIPGMEESLVIDSFRKLLISIMADGSIYTLDKILEVGLVQQFLHNEVIQKLYGFGNSIIIELLQCSQEITYKYTTIHLFTLGESITKKVAIDEIMNDVTDYIFFTDLVDRLEKMYGFISSNDVGYIISTTKYFLSDTNIIFKNKDTFYDFMRGEYK